ncbi:MAG: transposase [Planctomycetota bacterium]
MSSGLPLSDDAQTGRGYKHRKAWVRERLQMLSTVFAVELCSYAVMGNHVHMILRVRPDQSALWTAEELARRWWQLCPTRRDALGHPTEPTQDDLQQVLAEHEGGQKRVDQLLERLTSLSWFMKFFAERIARRANKADRCTGRFWEGRFKSQRLVGQNAVLACSIYNDLNPIRAAAAKTPEASGFTSGQDRILAHQAYAKLERALGAGKEPPRRERARLEAAIRNAGYLVPLGCEGSHLPSVTTEEYLELLDQSGREIKRGKRGAIPSEVAPILKRLALEVDSWFESVSTIGTRFSHLIGDAAVLAREVVRLRQK